MGAPGAQDKKWPKDSHDVGGGMLIPWLKTVRKMDVVGSRNDEWKFGKKKKKKKKTLYIAAGPTLPPHLYLLLQ
jgi:hypothetical protein